MGVSQTVQVQFAKINFANSWIVHFRQFFPSPIIPAIRYSKASEARKKAKQPQLTQIMPTIDVNSVPDIESKDEIWVDKLTESDENILVS